jgi:predicted  nucleic acid-binding Zn-ribbon protein
MTENIENLLLEHMKRFQAGQDRIERKLEELVGRAGRLEVSVAALRSDFSHADENTASISVRLDRLSERFDRIEKRLELVG